MLTLVLIINRAIEQLINIFYLIAFLEMAASNVETMLPCNEECKKPLLVLVWLVSSMASINVLLFHLKNIRMRIGTVVVVVLRLTSGLGLSLFNRQQLQAVGVQHNVRFSRFY